MKQMSEQQWLLLGKLVQRYSSLLDGIELLSQLYPQQKRLLQIKKGLEKGNTIDQLLEHRGFEGQLQFYCQYIPLSNAIEIVEEKRVRQQNFQKEFLSKITYQLLLLFISLVVLAVFSTVVLPQMISVLQLSNAQSNNLIGLFQMVIIIRNIVMVVIAFVVVCTSYILLRKRQTYFWMFLHRLNKDGVMKQLATYRFAQQLKILLDHGIDFHQAISIVRFDQKDRMAALLAYHLNERLNSGMSLQNALQMEYFDEQFQTVCLYGLLDDDFSKSLQDYLVIVQQKGKAWIRYTSAFIQGLCYCFAIIVIVLAYQVLLLPLELLEGL